MKRLPTLERLESRHVLASFTPMLVADITPGEGSTEFGDFYPAENHLYFTVNEGDLWRTDGSEETTFLGNNITPKTRAYQQSLFMELPNGVTLFYTADNGDWELWLTDGTHEGTRSWLADRRVVQSPVAVSESWVLLPLRHGEHTEFWRVDAESEPILLHTVLNQSDAFHIETHDGVAYFNREMTGYNPPETTQLIRTDGTLAGTKLLSSNLTSNPVPTNEGLLFVARNGSQDVVFQITHASQEPARWIELPWAVIDFRPYGERFGFFVESLSEKKTPQWELGFSDGTQERTSLLDVPPTTTRPSWIGEFGGALLYRGNWATNRTNGTVAGTYVLSTTGYMGQINGRAYLIDGFFGGYNGYFTDGAELFDAWPPPSAADARQVSKGQNQNVRPPAPTYRFDQTGLTIQSRSSSNEWGVSSETRFEPDEAGVLIQQGPARVLGTHTALVEDEWYSINTHRVARAGATIVEKTKRVEPNYQDALEFVHSVPGEQLYFAYGTQGQERLWVIGKDQTLEEIGPFNAASLGQTTSHVFYNATTPESGLELWATNGTLGRTEEIDFGPGATSSEPEIVPWKDTTFVTANTPDHGRELWRIDGSFPTLSESLAPGLRPVDLLDGIGQDIPIELIHSAGVTDASWDLNNDGEFGDAVGANPTLDWQLLDSLQPSIPRNTFQPFRVQFTNASGAPHVKTSLIRIRNPTPSIEDIVGLPTELQTLQPFDFEVLASDQDEILYSVDFGDGTVVSQTETVFAHQYTRLGKYTVSISVEDEHGTRSVEVREITVHPSDASKVWRFRPGAVFGDNAATTDIALWDGYYLGYHQDWVITSASDGPSQRFRVVDDGSRVSPIQVGFTPVQNSTGFDIASLEPYGDPTAVFATTTGIVADDQPWPLGADLDSRDLAFADLNGDGAEDIFIANYQDADGVPAPDLVLLQSSSERSGFISGGSNFELHASLPPVHSSSVEIGDLTGDGTPDVVTIGPSSSRIWFNDGQANFTESPQSLSFAAKHIAIGDLDGDGFNDLITANSGANHIWFNDGTGVFALSPQALGLAVSNHVAIGDMDGDGDLDLVFANGLGDGTTVWLNDGNGQFSDSGTRLAEDVNTTAIVLGHVNYDRLLDVIAAHSGVPNHIYLNQHGLQPLEINVSHTVRLRQLHEISVTFDAPASLDVLRLTVSDRGYVPIDLRDIIWSTDRKSFSVDLSDYDIGGGQHTLDIHVTGDTPNVDTRTRVQQSIRVFHAGDLDQNGRVDDADFRWLANFFGSSSKFADIDGDGVVGFSDFLLLAHNYGKL